MSQQQAVTYPSIGKQNLSQVATVAASGIATVTFPDVSYDRIWLVEIVGVAGAGAGSDASLYVGSVDNSNLRGYTASGNKAVADQASEIFIPSSSRLIVQWTGGTSGNVAVATIEYDECIVNNVLIGDDIGLGAYGSIDSMLIESGFPNSLAHGVRRGKR